MFIRHKSCTGHRAAIYALARSHTPNHFLSAGGDGWIVEWNLADPETGRLLANIGTQLFSLTTSPEDWHEQLIIAGNMTGGIHWINQANPLQNKNIQHHQKGVFSLLWVQDELFSAGGDGILTRWNPSKKSAIESYQLSNKSLRSISYSPEQDLLAVGSSDGNIYLTQRADLKLVQIIPAHTNSVFALSWINPEQILVSGGRDALLKAWDNNFQQVGAQPAHWYTINHIAQSPDLSLIATASRDKTIKIWSTPDLALLKVLDSGRDSGHFNSVNHLLWMTENTLISCSDDRTVLIWQFTLHPTQELYTAL